MTEHDDSEEAVAARFAALCAQADPELGVGSLTLLVARFPVPDTEGLPPDAAEAVLDRWRARVHAYVDAQRDPAAVPAAPPQAPVL